MSNLNQSVIKSYIQTANANDCFQELKRENKMRAINYPKWAIGNAKKKLEFERQIALTMKLQNLFSVIHKAEWEKLEERFLLREAARAAEQITLF